MSLVTIYKINENYITLSLFPSKPVLKLNLRQRRNSLNSFFLDFESQMSFVIHSSTPFLFSPSLRHLFYKSGKPPLLSSHSIWKECKPQFGDTSNPQYPLYLFLLHTHTYANKRTQTHSHYLNHTHFHCFIGIHPRKHTHARTQTHTLTILFTITFTISQVHTHTNTHARANAETKSVLESIL